MRSILSTYNEQANKEKDSIVWVIDVKNLRTGDIILSTTSSFVSLGIKIATRSSVSHAALHVGNGFIIEAVSGGVRRINARSLIYPKSSYVKVLRPNQQPEEQINIVSNAARTFIDRPYSTSGAIGSTLPLVRQRHDPGRFCSQLVAEAYEQAELSLFPSRKPENITPNDILKCKFLNEITDDEIVRPVRRGSLFHALGQMQPDWVHHNPNLRENTIQITPEQFEQEITNVCAKSMKKYSCFVEPYHYSDVLRQLRRAFDEDKEASLAVDEEIIKIVRKYDAALGAGVEPKVTFPGLISSTPSPDLLLMFDGGDHPDDEKEILRLHEDILYGRLFDENEWDFSVSEIRNLYKETSLSAYNGILFWLLGDQGRMQATYHWLAMEN